MARHGVLSCNCRFQHLKGLFRRSACDIVRSIVNAHRKQKGETMEPIKLALLGCGGIMKAHIRGLERLRKAGIVQFDIVAACDIVEENSRELASQVEALQGRSPQTFTDLNEMLENAPEIEAVDICTVHSEHHTSAIPCLEAGKHVILEKPIGISMRAGKLILDAAVKSRKTFMVAENYRFALEERARKWAIESGRIGKPRMFFWLDVSEDLEKWGWRNFKHLAGGGWVLDGGVHFADLFRYHLGCEAQQVYAGTKYFEPRRYTDVPNRSESWEVSVEDASFALLEFENDIVVQWTTAHTAPGEGFCRRVLYGSEGSLDWEAGLTSRGGAKVDNKTLQKEFLATLSEDQKERLFPGGVQDVFAIEIKELADCVRSGKAPEITGLEGYKDLGLCMALFESAWHNRPVTLREIETCELEGYQADLNAAL